MRAHLWHHAAAAMLALLPATGDVLAEGPQQGQHAPDATFVAIDGRRFDLSAYRDQKAVVLLFARGSTGSVACYYCGVQTREYKREYQKIEAAGAEVLFVLPGPSDVRGYLRQVGENGDPPDPGFSVPFPVVIDPDFSATRAFGVPYTPGRGPMFVNQPATFVVGKDGTVLYAYHGRDPSDRAPLSTVLSVLSGAKATEPKPPEASRTPTPARPTIPWVNYEEGIASARTRRKPILLEFYADWCGNCRQMDALVYADDRVRADSAAFVPIRAEYDRSQDLVKQYSIGNGLPVLVLLDPDGREVSRLTGFTSVPKVLAALEAAREGRAPAEETKPPVTMDVPVTPQTVAAARTRALAFVRAAWPRAKATAPGLGPDDLVLFTLVACGADGGDADVARITSKVLGTPLAGTYQASLRALAFSTLDVEGRPPVLRACSEFLLRTQLENGQWSYGSAPGAPLPPTGDNSNSAFALLGLAACREAGIAVPKAAFERADAWWRRSQNQDGGWGYRVERETDSYASMTENALSSLLLCARVLGRPPTDATIERARAWIVSHFSVDENAKSAYQQGRILYHLYALERIGDLLGVERLGDRDWHRGGVARLLSTQADDGSWDDGSETFLSNTCLGLLFLSRPTKALR